MHVITIPVVTFISIYLLKDYSGIVSLNINFDVQCYRVQFGFCPLQVVLAVSCNFTKHLCRVERTMYCPPCGSKAILVQAFQYVRNNVSNGHVLSL